MAKKKAKTSRQRKSATKTILVECTFTIPVDVPAYFDDEQLHFHIEENGCPGTGFVGSEFLAHCQRQEAKSMCWACALDGKNKIVPADSKTTKAAIKRAGKPRVQRVWSGL